MRGYLFGVFLAFAAACTTPTSVVEQVFEHYSTKNHGKWENKHDYVNNPIKADDRSLANGRELFAKYCAVCHGLNGKGDGERAGKLPQPPADLTRINSTKTDYGIYLQVAYGGSEMPPWMKQLTPQSRWDIVNYIRALAK